MKRQAFYIYFDSGTSNSRVYVLDEEFHICYAEKKNIGSRDSAIAGDNIVLIRGLKELFDDAVKAMQLEEDQIIAVYASGLVTSPYGLKEIPHLVLPVRVEDFAEQVYPFYEDKLFHRTIHLVPGLKTQGDDISLVNNMRGEEMEIMGVMDEAVRICGGGSAALIFPGSHTHVAYVKDGEVAGIVSNLTGELFYALKKDTILAPVLEADSGELQPAYVKKGVENLRTYGFCRAIYIAHAMRLFREGTEADRFSYAEGVINGGVRESLELYCREWWSGCDTAVVVGEEFMYRLFSDIFEGSELIRNVRWIPISAEKSYAVEGLKKILTCRKTKQDSCL